MVAQAFEFMRPGARWMGSMLGIRVRANVRDSDSKLIVKCIVGKCLRHECVTNALAANVHHTHTARQKPHTHIHIRYVSFASALTVAITTYAFPSRTDD